MKKENKSKNKNKKSVDELSVKINKEKQELTIDIIQYNHKMDNLLKQMALMMQECDKIDKLKFTFQRELLSRNKMNMRVINSAIKMIDNNKLQLWMIDENVLEEKVKNENK